MDYLYITCVQNLLTIKTAEKSFPKCHHHGHLENIAQVSIPLNTLCWLICFLHNFVMYGCFRGFGSLLPFCQDAISKLQFGDSLLLSLSWPELLGLGELQNPPGLIEVDCCVNFVSSCQQLHWWWWPWPIFNDAISKFDFVTNLGCQGGRISGRS